MRILFVTPYLASPPACGAQRRLEGLMKGLGVRHEVWLLSFAMPNSTEYSTTGAYCHRLITVQHDVLRLDASRKRILQLRSLTSTSSYEKLLYRDPRIQSHLDELVKANAFDVVQFEFAQMGIYQLPRSHARPPVYVLDEHNIEFDIVKRTASAEGGVLRRVYSSLNWRKVRDEELDAWQRFDGVALTSKRDEALLKADVPTARTAVIPNAVDLEAFAPNSAQIETATLLFLGALDYHPNVDGMEFFLDEIWPIVRANSQNVRLVVVGRNPPDCLLKRQSNTVQFTGFVEDPREYLDRAAIVIVPLRIGGGTRFKIIEAMAKSKPIISTSVGAEGLDALNDKHLLLADSAAEFAEGVHKLLDEPDRAAQLGRAGRLFVEDRYGWKSVVGKLEEFYDELIAERRLKSP